MVPGVYYSKCLLICQTIEQTDFVSHCKAYCFAVAMQFFIFGQFVYHPAIVMQYESGNNLLKNLFNFGLHKQHKCADLKQQAAATLSSSTFCFVQLTNESTFP